MPIPFGVPPLQPWRSRVMWPGTHLTYLLGSMSWVVFPSHATSCSLYGVTFTPSSNSDHSKFFIEHVALSKPTDWIHKWPKPGQCLCLSEKGPTRTKDEAQWWHQKHFWDKVLFLDIYKSAEMCAILSGLSLGKGKWWCISHKEMWFRGGAKAATFWKGHALFLAFIQHNRTASWSFWKLNLFPPQELKVLLSTCERVWRTDFLVCIFTCAFLSCHKPQYLICCHCSAISLITWRFF